MAAKKMLVHNPVLKKEVYRMRIRSRSASSQPPRTLIGTRFDAEWS
jgi:hypothetical protein